LVLSCRSDCISRRLLIRRGAVERVCEGIVVESEQAGSSTYR